MTQLIISEASSLLDCFAFRKRFEQQQKLLEEERKRRQFEEQKQKLRLLSSVKPKVMSSTPAAHIHPACASHSFSGLCHLGTSPGSGCGWFIWVYPSLKVKNSSFPVRHCTVERNGRLTIIFSILFYYHWYVCHLSLGRLIIDLNIN